MNIPEIPKELIQKYSRPGPRYTSYPPVPVWTPDFDETSYRTALSELAGFPGETLSLYVHLPFCASGCAYCGCNATVTTKPEVVSAYLDRLAREIGLIVPLLGKRRTVAQMHWGGGTPNFPSVEELTRLVRLLEEAFDFHPEAERSIEIDPRIASRRQLRAIRNLGFNRVSLGVQEFDPDVQNAIGRIQPEEVTKEVYDTCRSLEFESVNLDLVYGLPEQTLPKFSRTIREIIAMRPDRVACFNYAHVPTLRANQRRIDATTLPTSAERFTMFGTAIGLFEAAGYGWIGMDHFARRGDELAEAAEGKRLHRNFMGYTVKPAPHLLSFGMSAISEFAGYYAQNDARLGRYQAALDDHHLPITRGHRLTADDVLRRDAIANLLCNFELPLTSVERLARRSSEMNVPDEFDRLEPFVEDGLLRFEADRVVVTRTGRFFIRNICMELDTYLRTGAPLPVFSKTV